MSLPSINFYTLQFQSYCLDKKLYRSRSLRQDQMSNQGHTMTLHTYIPQPCPYQVPTSYTLQFLRYSPGNILKVKVTTTRSEVKSRSHHNVAHLHPLSSVPTKYQLPTPYACRDIARTRFYRSRSLRYGQRSNQDHTRSLHTYHPQPISLPSINFLHLKVSEI